MYNGRQRKHESVSLRSRHVLESLLWSAEVERHFHGLCHNRVCILMPKVSGFMEGNPRECVRMLWLVVRHISGRVRE